MSGITQRADGELSILRINFAAQAAETDRVLLRFDDPAGGCAVLSGDERGAAGLLEVILLPASGPEGEVVAVREQAVAWLEAGAGDEHVPAVFVRYRGVELRWREDRVLLECNAELAEQMLMAIAEFAWFERELRGIEREIAQGWPEVEQDKAIAFEATAKALKRSEEVGERMQSVFQRRIRMARIEPHLYWPDARLGSAGYKLGEELREKARIEARVEAVDGQLEVCEYVYEMSSQRLGEFRASHGEHVMELVIIVLLAAETLLMLAATMFHVGR